MSEAIRIAFQYRHQLGLLKRLGDGRDGKVYETDRNTAVKFFTVRENYLRELAAYQRLARLQIASIGDYAIPVFIDNDDDLLAIEMTIVQPPFLVDFASAYDEADAPDFSDEVWQDYFERKRDEFGERWAEVDFVLAELARMTGLVMLDINPGNIRFADGDVKNT